MGIKVKGNVNITNYFEKDSHPILFQNNHNGKEDAEQEEQQEPRLIEAEEVLPKSMLLEDPECRAMLELLRDAGWLTDEFMPAEGLHKPDMAQMASAVSYKRWGENRWVPFEQLWGVKNLANSMSRANNQKGSGDKAQEITRILKNMK